MQFTRRKADCVAGLLWDRVSHAAVFYYGAIFAVAASVGLFFIPGNRNRSAGEIVMQVRGGKEVTLTPGQTFYEGPGDVHVVGRNASKTKPAKFVVFLVKDKGAPVLVPAK